MRLVPGGFADKIKPLGSIRSPWPERIEDLDAAEVSSKPSEDPSPRKRGLGDLFMDQIVAISPLMFENFHIPDKFIAPAAGDFDDDQIPVKPFFPGRASAETPQFAEGVDVENEQTSVVEMPLDSAKGSLPVGKT